MLEKLAVAALCLAAGVATAATTKWTITPIGDPWMAFAEDVNNRGDVTGWKYGPSRVPMHHAFVWRNGVMEDIGLPPGWLETSGIAVNNSGTVAANGPATQFAIWSNGTWTDTHVRGNAYDINESGAVTGGYIAGDGMHAFVWKDGNLTDLGTLGGAFASGRAINNSGMVAGFSGLAGSANVHAFVHDGTTMRDLGTLGGANSWAYAMNAGGTVVGGSQDATGTIVAMIWEGGVMRPLLSTPVANSFARAINDRGQVVGTLPNGSFLYENGTMTRLESIPAVAAAGWTNLIPYGINDRGWIVGTGAKGGAGFSFVLMPN